MAVFALSRASIRAAGDLRRPSESRALPTFPSTIYLMMCVGLLSQPTFPNFFSPMQRRPKDPKIMARKAGIQGIGPSASRRRRWISSISSWLGTNFGRRSGHFVYVVAQLEKKSP